MTLAFRGGLDAGAVHITCVPAAARPSSARPGPCSLEWSGAYFFPPRTGNSFLDADRSVLPVYPPAAARRTHSAMARVPGRRDRRSIASPAPMSPGPTIAR